MAATPFNILRQCNGDVDTMYNLTFNWSPKLIDQNLIDHRNQTAKTDVNLKCEIIVTFVPCQEFLGAKK